jgi:acyl carrier protein
MKFVREMIVEQLGISEEQITPEARLGQDLGADSLDIAEMTLALETEFNISIPDANLDPDPSVDMLCEVLSDVLHPEQKVD